MARKASSKAAATAANLGFEAKLWLAADKLRNNMDAAEYKHVVLGLIFLKYISDTFTARSKEIEARLKDPADDYFLAGATPEALAAELECRRGAPVRLQALSAAAPPAASELLQPGQVLGLVPLLLLPGGHVRHDLPAIVRHWSAFGRVQHWPFLGGLAPLAGRPP